MAAPTTELDPRFSMDVPAVSWEEGRKRLRDAELYWLSTVRSDGRPHVTPLIAVWVDEALYFCTGPGEQKARNLETNKHCVLTTGTNTLNDGLDVVVEGSAERVTDDAKLQRIADAYESEYGSDWHFDVGDGAFHHDAGEAYVFEVAPTKAFGFAKGAYGQTRWRF